MKVLFAADEEYGLSGRGKMDPDTFLPKFVRVLSYYDIEVLTCIGLNGIKDLPNSDLEKIFAVIMIYNENRILFREGLKSVFALEAAVERYISPPLLIHSVAFGLLTRLIHQGGGPGVTSVA